jgi:hypothetical protein
LVRIWPEFISALKAFGFESNVPLAEYVRGKVHNQILQRGAALRERDAALRALINAEAIYLRRGRWRLRCWTYSERENQYGNDGDGGRNPPRGGTPTDI